ncbi:DUF4983 domain-containing protein [Sphingobacterium sp. LRF_L2]|uniref:DUF4983 domain-containing protein n=1 Tax=Sphingobacterium sp. LRF_L2 TaxID=3369421 RepID=UPI003F5D92D9
MNLKNIFNIQSLIGLVCIVSVWCTGCKEDFSKLIPTTADGDSINVVYGNPHVLLIVVDGARGQTVQQLNPTNISKLLPRSIYTWVGLSEEDAQGIAANWTGIFTGVNYKKHGVIDNDFSSNNLDTYPSVFKRIMAYDETMQINLVSPNEAFLSNYGEDSKTTLAANDQSVTDEVVRLLGQENPTMLTAHFEEVQKAGKESGFDRTFDQYVEAIRQFDQRVGEMVAAVESRANYQKEEWLIIITSSQGGDFEIPANENDNTVFSNAAVNTFTIMYSPKYQTKFIGKPYIGNKFTGDFMQFNDTKYAELLTEENSLFDLGMEDFTVELKIKKNKGPSNNYNFSYPSVIGKRASWQSGWDQEIVRGWVIHLADASWIFNARGTTGYGEVKADKELNKGTWNTITLVGANTDGKRMVRLYTNGTLSKEAEITGWGAINSDAHFKLGFLPTKETWRSDAYLADVKIWKVAMPEDIVNDYACEIGVDAAHPYYNYLAGYWPVMGATDDGMLMDYGPFGANLKLGGAYSSALLTDYICTPSTVELGALVPRTYDVPTQIISWLKVPRQLSWQLDGRVWLDK